MHTCTYLADDTAYLIDFAAIDLPVLDNAFLSRYVAAHPAPQAWLDDVDDDPLGVK